MEVDSLCMDLHRQDDDAGFLSCEYRKAEDMNTYQRSIVAIDDADAKKMRDAADVECMQSAGWLNTASWKTGKKDKRP